MIAYLAKSGALLDMLDAFSPDTIWLMLAIVVMIVSLGLSNEANDHDWNEKEDYNSRNNSISRLINIEVKSIAACIVSILLAATTFNFMKKFLSIFLGGARVDKYFGKSIKGMNINKWISLATIGLNFLAIWFLNAARLAHLYLLGQ